MLTELSHLFTGPLLNEVGNMGPLPGDSHAGMITTKQRVHESHCGPWTSSSSHTQELVSGPPPRATASKSELEADFCISSLHSTIRRSLRVQSEQLRPCTRCISIENLPQLTGGNSPPTCTPSFWPRGRSTCRLQLTGKQSTNPEVNVQTTNCLQYKSYAQIGRKSHCSLKHIRTP